MAADNTDPAEHGFVRIFFLFLLDVTRITWMRHGFFKKSAKSALPIGFIYIFIKKSVKSALPVGICVIRVPISFSFIEHRIIKEKNQYLPTFSF